MGRVKEMAMEIEERVYDTVADFIPECENVSEAQARALLLAEEQELLFYLDKEHVEEAVSEMWNDYWSKYV